MKQPVLSGRPMNAEDQSIVYGVLNALRYLVAEREKEKGSAEVWPKQELAQRELEQALDDQAVAV
jgi:hypothetical protein